jgi:hypothetical protein
MSELVKLFCLCFIRKNTFPEYLGKDVFKSRIDLQEKYPNLDIQIISELNDNFFDESYDENRVQLYHLGGIISEIPERG